MGEFKVKVKISSLNGKRRSTSVMLLVDTGATLADEREVKRKLGEARFEIAGRSAPALVVFGEATNEPVLGVTILEQIRFGVDPVRRRLIPARLLYV